MTLSTLKYKTALYFCMFIIINTVAYSQTDTVEILTKVPADTSSRKLNMDAVYNRPFLVIEKTPIAIGGYAEANTHYSQTDGISDGFSFQMRRMTIFLSSTITERIKFLSEIEFENGTKEINIEYAAVDIEFDPLLNMRGGIIINPIGSFNQNHDGPRWDFINRPISSTTILPATFSTVGFGIYGKYFYHNWVLGYESYLSNGFDDKIIANEQNRTSLAEGKLNPDKFEESNSGLPMFTGKLAIRHRKIGEIGISYLTGVYNKWKNDGVIIDKKRTADAIAIDCNTSLFDNNLTITAEAVKVVVDVPDSYSQTFGSRQFGGFIDIVGTAFQTKIFDWEKAKVNLGIRLEYADYNQGTFKETNTNIADDLWAIVGSIAFRPVETTVLRLNYHYQQQTDLLGNPPFKTGIIQFGFSTYF